MFISTALAITLAQASAPHCDQVDTTRLSAAIRPFAEADAFRGSVRVECDGEVIFEQSYGLAVEDWQITNTADTHFMLGSISKAYNAALILRLAELGRLDLDVPIGTYLAAFETSGITLRHLIAHSSGLPGIFTQTQSLADFAGRGVSREARNAAFAAYVAGLDLTSEPGERYAYSNVGAMLSAVVVEHVLGTTYEAALQIHLLEPLGLEQTGLVDETRPQSRLANGYAPGRDGVVNAPHVQWQHSLAIGNIHASTADTIAFADALFAGDFITTQSIQNELAQTSEGYPYGWHYDALTLESGQSLPRFSASGSTRGFSAELHHIPDTELSIALLANTGGMYFGPLAEALARISLGETADIPSPPMLRRFLASGLEIEAFLASLPQDQQHAVEVYQFGYELIRANFGQDAVASMHWVTRILPDEADAQVGLGDAYLRVGLDEEAEAAFEQALALQPDHAGARQRLDQD